MELGSVSIKSKNDVRNIKMNGLKWFERVCEKEKRNINNVKKIQQAK